MTDTEKLPASKISYYKESESFRDGINGEKTILSLSVESQTNEGALQLFRKLREETTP